MNLPEPIARACAPLFEELPIESAMPSLRGSNPSRAELVTQVAQSPELQGRPELQAGLWLYVDDLDRSHNICQGINDATGAFWHGIMHRREGDYSNSHYWIRRALGHPLLRQRPELEPDALTDDVASAADMQDPALVNRQRAEWRALFEWCAQAGEAQEAG